MNAILVVDTDDRENQETWLKILRIMGVEPEDVPALEATSADLATLSRQQAEDAPCKAPR